MERLGFKGKTKFIKVSDCLYMRKGGLGVSCLSLLSKALLFKWS